MAETGDQRLVEMETLQAIYGDSLSTDKQYCGWLELPVILQTPLKLLCTHQRNDEYEVAYLPPVRIRFELPEGYPNDTAPTIVLSAFWLPTGIAQDLEVRVLSTWEEYGRTHVMYAYASDLKEAAESAFGVHTLEVSRNSLPVLLDYDRLAKQQVFENGTYECGVCLDPKKGAKCHRMQECGHVFCVECLQGYFNDAILTGNIDNIKCPAYDCGGGSNDNILAGRLQQKRLITPRELLHIPIERAAVQRYVCLKRKRKLESDKSTIWCPRSWCQAAAEGNNYPKSEQMLEEMSIEFEFDVAPRQSIDENENEDEAATERKLLSSRLQVCEDCSYAFCRLCNRSWHGEFFDCRARTNTPSELTVLEKEEEASLEFIRQHTTKCPKCDTPVQKSEACNHMTCVRCRTHFCYLCSAFLNPMHPYDHFNKTGGFCYQRLWEGQNGEDVER